DLQVLITNLNPTSVLAGQSYSYVVTIFNLGPQNATNVNLVDHLGDGSYDNLITGGVLAAGNLQTITLTRTAVSGQATATVTVTANEIDRTSTDNSVSITETVVPLSQLTSPILQDAINAASATSPVVLAVDPNVFGTVVAAVNGLAPQANPVTLTLNLATGTYPDLQPTPPAGGTLVINGNGSPTNTVGHS